MVNEQSRPHIVIFAVLFACVISTLVMTACSSDKSKAKALVAQYLAGQGTTDIVIDFFHQSRNSPDKAYTGATVTYNFATSSGKPQREFLGFVLARSGDGWRIERNTSYTTEPDKAELYIAGGK
ncbi:MAG TPA: hypothetical protein VLM38_02000 [Blastocatellia bacterium]|nr:hypothetical protein [Blastocatellia bacterium]